ncbi:MAG: hypothetical protein L0Y44_01890 [Phycisphaerales bacterium]|nr:hypothetical protein [Phycisphaerales bacterium]MCI0629388.1 hypothetical protein [Phycisphaerales bacterium]MCI0676531.1 hypothetical protein [Phycisphaerales bacterium]
MSSGYPWTAWIFWIGGALLALSGLTLLTWSLFWDRSKGRRRCPRCWYDMSATPALICSECGKVAKRERKLGKTRRRWRLAIIAFLGVLSGGWLTLMPKADRDGWWSLVPNRVLIAGLPFAGSIDDFWCKEMARRVALGTPFQDPRFQSRFGAPNYKLTAREWEQFFDRCVAGDVLARPLSERWKQKYGELIHAWTQSGLFEVDPEAEAAQHKLWTLPLHLEVSSRPVWPHDAAPLVECSLQNWWPIVASPRALVTPRTPNPATILVGDSPDRWLILDNSTDEQMTFDVVYEGIPNQPGLATPSTETILIPIRRGGSAADYLTPVVSPDMDAAMRSLRYQVSQYRDGKGRRISFDTRSTQVGAFNGVAVGVVFEFTLNGEVVARQPVWWQAGAIRENFLPFAPPEGNMDRVFMAAPNETAMIRVRSDPNIALRVLDCDQYWEGEVTIPLKIVTR